MANRFSIAVRNGSSSVEEDSVVELLVPLGAVGQVVAVVAGELVAGPDLPRGPHAEYPSEARMREVAEAGVGEERVVDLVS